MLISGYDAWEGHGWIFWAVVIGLPPAAFLLCWGLHEAVILYVHYSVGALLCVVQLILAIALVSGAFEDRFLPEPKSESIEERKAIAAKLKVHGFVVDISASIAGALILITSFAWISYALVQLGFAATTIGSAPTYASLVETYGWHLVDLIPFMHVEKSLGMISPRIEFQGWAMGTPILAFRVLVGIFALTAIRRAWLRFVPDEASGTENI